MKSKDKPGSSKKNISSHAPSVQDGKLSIRSVRTSRSMKSARCLVLPTNEANQIQHYVFIPPDGGWGWFIVVIAFIAYFLMDGVCYTFGIFLSEIADTFNTETSNVAMISSYMTGSYYLSGPVACALCNKFGFRIVGFLGSIIAMLLFLIASYVENFIVFTILIGFGVGFAFDLVYTVMLLDVGFYFERYRALATAISVLGVSAGIMGFPVIFKEAYLLGNYHWKTKFLIISGSFFVLTLLTLALKPIKPTIVVENIKNQEDDSDSIGSFTLDESISGYKVSKLFDQFHNIVYPRISEYTTEVFLSETQNEPSTYIAILPDTEVASIFSRAFSNFSDYPSVYTKSEDINCCISNCCRSCFRGITCCQACCNWCQRKWNNCWSFLCRANKNVNRPMYRDDILYQFGSLSRLPEYNQSHTNVNLKTGSAQLPKNISYHLSVSRVITQKDIEEEKQCVCCPEAVLRVIATMLDLNLLKSVSFDILTFSSFLTMIGLYAPFVFIVERGEELELEDGWPTKLLSFMGLANCLGRVACGLLSFWPSLDPMIVSYLTLIVGGASIFASAFWTDLLGQIISTVIYGFCVASFTTLRTVLLASMFGLENLTNAFGITILFYGLASFIGIPTASFLQQYTGSYKYCFILSGGAVLLSGVVLIPANSINRKEKEKITPKVQFNV
ncbi:uncharacterized protein LOC130891706 isoform X1 [Diorhabda carinulata]|uniref:uncharacterized protein LOC130891706 isoform X1 n=1 Tax=Diorhabda carinulata TaxID=1163345 RepID=UPI0025A02614|nr:uncharacterized protein LOC130891706 isoform X1 [Diorhabda carinulata]